MTGPLLGLRATLMPASAVGRHRQAALDRQTPLGPTARPIAVAHAAQGVVRERSAACYQRIVYSGSVALSIQRVTGVTNRQLMRQPPIYQCRPLREIGT